MARHVPVFITLVLLLAGAGVGYFWPTTGAIAQGGAPVENDASSGADAGNTPHEATRIADARRVWSANLTPTGTDSDWYRLPAVGAFCAVVEASVGSPGSLTLAGSPELASTTRVEAMPHRPARLHLAQPDAAVPYFGIEAPMMSRLSGGDTSSHQPSPGRYTFSFQARTHAELDPERDGESPEAGPTPATSAALPQGCSAGHLSDADVRDHYHFDVGSEARTLALSFAVAAGSPAQLRVVTPSGATHTTLASGGAAEVWAAEPGRWSVVVSFPEAQPGLLRTHLARLAPEGGVLETDYLLAASDGPGDTDPCRPSCMG